MNKIIKDDIHRILSDNINWNKLKNANILITGSTGLIGQYLVYTLTELNKKETLNIKIYAMSRSKESYQKMFSNIKNVFPLIQDVEQKLENKDFNYIIHCASPASPEYFDANPVGTILANTIGTNNLLDLTKNKDTQFIFLSSMEIYGNLTDDINNVKEEQFGAIDSLSPRSCYHLSKKTAENLCISYNKQYGTDCKIVRAAHTYGPGMDINSERVQCDFIKKFINNEDIILKSDGTMLRTYTYISDVISGIFYIALNSTEITYNVVNNDSIISIRQLAETIISTDNTKKSKLKFELEKNSGWAKEKSKILNCDKLKDLGWKPKINILEGIKNTINYYNQIEDK